MSAAQRSARGSNSASQTASAQLHQGDHPKMSAPGISSASLLKGIEELVERLDRKLAAFLEEVGIVESVAQLRDEFCEALRRDGAVAREIYYGLNLERISSAPNSQVIVGMVFAAVEEARYLAASEPLQAFVWLMDAGYIVGYGSGIANDAYVKRSSKEARSAAAREGQPGVQALKQDVLAFLDEHQPVAGWNRKQALHAYVNQDLSKGSPLVQDTPGDDWAGMDAKLPRWLKTDAQFSEAFEARLKASSQE